MRYLILALCLLPLVALADINTAVMTSGNQTVNGVKTFTETVVGSVTGNAGTLGGHDSTYFQPAATAINTGNISAQSVDYAATAGDAPDLTGRAVFQSYTSLPRAATTVQNTWAAFQNFSGGLKASDVIATGPTVSGRAFMSPATLAAWESDSTTDVTAELQAALEAAGSRTDVPYWTWQNQTHNKAQGTLVLDKHAIYTISSPLIVPPGVEIRGNGATIKMTGTGDGIQCLWDNTGNVYGYGYGNYFSGISDLHLEGPGSGTSTGRGLFLHIVNNGRFRNITIKGFKFGVTLQEVQYSTFQDVGAMYNQVGWYITAQPSLTNLTSIDNLFLNTVATYNTKYGLWAQCQSASTFDKIDAQKNGVVDVLIGSQLVGYISGYTVTDGGSGYTPSTTIPATITDASGTMAQAYAVTDGSGVVTAVHSIDAGSGYVSPTVSIPGGAVAATVTATVANDTGLGDWDGHSATNRGKNVFNNLKVEHGGGERPSSGYAIIINDSSQRQNSFNELVVQRQGQSGGIPQYFRWMRTAGYGTTVTNPGDPSTNNPGSITNPAVSGDVSIFRAMDFQSLAVRYPLAFNSTLFPYYTVDDSGTIAPTNGKVAYSGFTAGGTLQSQGYEAITNGISTSTTPANGMLLKNGTTATVGAPDQNSPAVVFSSRSYYGGQDNEDQWAIVNKAVSAGSRSDLTYHYKNGSGSWTQSRFSLVGDGTAAVTAATGLNTLVQGLLFGTSTAATAGGNSISPALQLYGRGWQTGTGGSQAMAAGIAVKPETGATNPVGVLQFNYGTNTTATTTSNELMRLEWGDRLGASFNDQSSTGYKFKVKGLPVYANNAAAVAGGLSAGHFYRTGGDPDLVCVVH